MSSSPTLERGLNLLTLAIRSSVSWRTWSPTVFCTCSATTTRRKPIANACASARRRRSAHLASPAEPLALPVRRVARSFGYAFAGLLAILRTTPNFWLHIAAAAAALLVSILLSLPPAEIALVVLVIALVLVI